ncbi:thiol-disulfide isomerase/thioredoxin [Pedobacter sp. UYP24]
MKIKKRLSLAHYLILPLVLLVGFGSKSLAQQADAGIKKLKPFVANKAKSVTITGKINKLLVSSPNALDVFTFQYRDATNGKLIIVPINKDTAGNFTATIPLHAKQQILLNQTYKNGDRLEESFAIEFLFFAAPGEDMQLDYYLPAGFVGRRIAFKGNLGLINNQDRVYQDSLDRSEFSPLIAFKIADSVKAGNYEAYKKYVAERLKAGLAFNDAYFKSVKNHPYLKEMSDINMRYNAANMILTGLYRAKMTDSLLLDFFKENGISLNDIKARGDDRYANFVSMYYWLMAREFENSYKEPHITLAGIARYVASEYPELNKQYNALAIKLQDTTVKRSLEENNEIVPLFQPYIDDYEQSIHYKQFFDYLMAIKDPILRDQYVAKQLNGLLKNGDVRQVRRLIAAYKSKVKPSLVKDDLLKKYQQEYEKVYNSKLSARSVLNVSNDLKTDSLWAEILNKHKGKVIYVDVWATWCKPCLAEMGNSKLLREKLLGKGVVFLYLCISSQTETLWKSLIAQNEMEGQHYFFNKKQSDELIQQLKIKGIPRYVLIDKSGNIANAEAGRPGNMLALKAIKELIQ